MDFLQGYKTYILAGAFLVFTLVLWIGVIAGWWEAEDLKVLLTIASSITAPLLAITIRAAVDRE